MRRSVTVMDYFASAVDEACAQLKVIFQDSIEIKGHVLGEAAGGHMDSHMFLLPSHAFLSEVRDLLPRDARVAFMNRTFSRQGLEFFENIAEGANVYIVGSTMEDAREFSSLAYSLGLKDLKIVPLGPHELEKATFKDDDVITTMYEELVTEGSNIVCVGSPLLDLNSILDIGVALDISPILIERDLKKDYKEIVPSRMGITAILERVNRYVSQRRLFFNNLDSGIVEFNTNRKAVMFNGKAGKILGIERGEDIDETDTRIRDLVRKISFNTVYLGRTAIEDEIINIDDKALVVSLYPVIQSGNLYGALAIIKEFHETEEKQHRIRSRFIGKGHRAKYTFDDIMGKSLEIRNCKDIARRMASSDSSILIQGETGTGKELFAQAMHNESIRREYQFVAINCGALPESILESELFGYEDGAFTGARKGGKPGLFEIAHKGTLFLDEIGEMPKRLQVKLLRVLQEREIMRLGSDRVIDVDVRIIAATNKNLEEMVEKNLFREDLYYRINILPLRIPPLRDRVGDLLDILNYYRDQYGGEFTLDKAAEAALLRHGWKGNVRELRNVAEYLVNIDKDSVGLLDLPFTDDESRDRRLDALPVADDEDEFVVDFDGDDPDKYRFVLSVLYESRLKMERLGRRTIYQKAISENVFISENEIRDILRELGRKSYVVVGKGRGGSHLTDEGARLFERMDK